DDPGRRDAQGGQADQDALLLRRRSLSRHRSAARRAAAGAGTRHPRPGWSGAAGGVGRHGPRCAGAGRCDRTGGARRSGRRRRRSSGGAPESDRRRPPPRGGHGGERARVSTDLRIAETTVLDALKNGGFAQLIDPEIAAEKTVQVGGIATEITAAQARKLKSLTGAEVILFGQAVAIARGEVADLV